MTNYARWTSHAREVGSVGPSRTCADANVNRWHYMRGHALPEEDKPAEPGICPLVEVRRKGANR